jgi:hypothetical protein
MILIILRNIPWEAGWVSEHSPAMQYSLHLLFRGLNRERKQNEAGSKYTPIGVTYHKTEIFIVVAVRTLNPTQFVETSQRVYIDMMAY